MSYPNLACVVVTYNRLDKLKKTLETYEAQTVPFNSLIIVDNHSTDGTHEFLLNWKNATSHYKRFVLTMEENKGGSGGFYEGEKFALSLNSDWIHVADDDAYPKPNMVKCFYDFISTHGHLQLAAVCSTVLYPNGERCLYHRSRIAFSITRDFNIVPVAAEEYGKEFFPITLFSYVGTFLNARSLNHVGLVNPDYFIYADDSEHSLRLRHDGNIVCVPALQIIHDSCSDNNDNGVALSWKDYYFMRNNLHMIKKHYPLSLPRTILGKYISTCKGSMPPQKVLFWTAVKDALRGKLGLHPLYKPGYEIRK